MPTSPNLHAGRTRRPRHAPKAHVKANVHPEIKEFLEEEAARTKVSISQIIERMLAEAVAMAKAAEGPVTN